VSLLRRLRRVDDWPVFAKGLVALAFPLGALAVAVVLFRAVQKETEEAASWVEHTLRAKERIQDVQALMVDAETGVRGFLLAGSEEFLEPYTRAESSFNGAFERLEAILRDNPAQIERLAGLRAMAGQRLEALRTLVKEGRSRSQPDLVLLWKSNGRMTQFREQVAAMLAEEDRLFAERTAARDRLDRSLRRVVAGAGLVGLLGGILASVFFSSSLLRRLARVKENASRLARREALLPGSPARDEVGELDAAVARAASLLDERDGALRRAHDELATANRDLAGKTEEAFRASQMKSEFLANMSHELRTPLNAIIGFAELMHDGKVGAVSPEHKEFLGDILTSARHLLELINGVLDLAKVEAGKMEFFPVEVDPRKVLFELVGILRALAARKRIEIVTEVAPDLGKVVADPGKLKQVLYNYLSNALKFTPVGGRVTVRVGQEGEDRFRVEVEDTGPGVPVEEMERLFVPFQQLDVGVRKREAGTGLGLALTRRIVEAQGGVVGLRPGSPGGAIFFAILPKNARVAPASTEIAPTIERKPPLGGPRILVVEDDPVERSWLVTTLTDSGYRPEAATSGAEAIVLAREQKFDAVTMDLLLNDQSGWEVLSALRAEGLNRDTPVIVVTVVKEEESGAAFRFDEFLVKPVSPKDLIGALTRLGVPPGQKRRVLVVDDDPATLKFVDGALRDAGYLPVLSSDPRGALDSEARSPSHAVVLDLLMPGMDGFEFLERFRSTEMGRATPVVVFTSKDLTAEDQTRLRRGAQAVVLKGPGGSTALLRELTTLVGPGHRVS
jgi:signal transduction histidine kinase/DNA-binding response OmpR family regulator